MYPTVSDILYDLFGFYVPLPIQSFGFFVALAFIIASYFWTKEVERKTKEGVFKATFKKVLIGKKAKLSDYLTTGIISFFIGYKIGLAFTNYQSLVENPQSFIISLKGNFIVGLLFSAVAVYQKYKEKKKEELETPVWKAEKLQPKDHVANMTMISAGFGLFGAKIFHLLENPDQIATMLDSVNNFFSGLTMYGGLIMGGAAVLYYAKKQNFNLLAILDSGAPAVMLGYGIGRIGCQMAGDGDWGINNLAPIPSTISFLPHWMWSFSYPHNVISAGIPITDCTGGHCFQLANPVWPTPFYEATASIGLFLVLWNIRKKITIPGILFCIYLMMNGFERFWVEKIRINEVYSIFGNKITQAEIISTLLFIIGGVGIWYLNKREKTNQ